jgi:hypothetical protein
MFDGRGATGIRGGREGGRGRGSEGGREDLLDVLERQGASVEVVHDTTRSADENVKAGFQVTDLTLVWDAAVDGADPQA